MFKNQKQIESNLRFFTWLGAILITLILPYLYLLGLAYYQGYMDAFGVSSDIFPLSTADVYVKAFLAISLVITENIRALTQFLTSDWEFILESVLLLSGVLYLIIYFSKVQCIAKYIGLIETSNKETQNAKGFESLPTLVLNIADLFFKGVLVLSLSMIVLWSGVRMAVKTGEGIALDSINKYTKNGCQPKDSKSKWSDCVKLVNDSELTLQEGLFVAKNPEEIALFRKEGSFVFRLRDDVVIMKLRNK